MRIGFDSKLLPANGEEPQFAVVLLHGRNAEDATMRLLAGRWREHMGDTLFAMPIFHGAVEIVDEEAVVDPSAPSIGLVLGAEALDAYIAGLRNDYGLTNDRIAIVGHMEGVALAFYHGLRQVESPSAIIGFSGDIEGFSDLRQDVKGRPPVLLVHGENDPVVSPVAFLQNYQALSQAGVPVSICFRPGVEREIESFGADSAMFFLKGVQATRPPRAAKAEKPVDDVAKSIKLVIWDLDETLWQGTLDDADAIVPHEARVEALRRLNRSGIVSAICSKNDFDIARRKLEALGLWDEFVFPRIAFVPKGAAIQTLIKDMQLKPKNCLFVDDNDINLAEAKAVLPDLHTLDAKSEDCDAFLARLVESHAHVQKSRVEEYRSLQSRLTEGEAFEGDREAFLRTCDIHVAIATSSDLVDFAPRLEELINRTNQLNYMKTRVQPGSMVDFVSEASLREGFALFAWDKFGYHGLVGFIAADVRTEALLHMAFSCRIMHMGMESVLLHEAFQRFRNLQVPDSISVTPEIPSWITVEGFNNPEVRARILAEENSPDIDNRDVRIRFMANCQSGVFAHFSGLRDVAEIDSHPRIFVLSMILNKSYRLQNYPPAVVHYIGSDFFNVMWPREAWEHLESGLYEHCASEFCDFLKVKGRRLLVIGNPGDVGVNDDHIMRGITTTRMAAFGDVWRRLAAIRDEVDFLDVDGFVNQDRMVDCAHFRVDASRDIAKRITAWYESLPEELFEQQQLDETA